MQGLTSILVDNLPNVLVVNGEKFPIYSDHKTCLIFTELNNDETLTMEERISLSINLFYKTPPKDTFGAYSKLCQFYTRGVTSDGGKKLICFTQDADYIYSAFRSQYGIDLADELIHWWKFLALLKGLKRDEVISEIMGIRGMDISSGWNGSTKAHYRRLKHIYRIKNDNDITDEFIGSAFSI